METSAEQRYLKHISQTYIFHKQYKKSDFQTGNKTIKKNQNRTVQNIVEQNSSVGRDQQ